MSEPSPAPVDEDESPGSSSITSSTEYEQEPFEAFRNRVQELAQSLWPGETVKVERMTGGGFNRIIGLSIKGPSPDQDIECVLRVPRFDAARLDRDVAALLFVRRFGDIPSPNVIAFDVTANNKLGGPYMVQNRLRGIDLLSAFNNLSQQNRCNVAHSLGYIFRRMLSVTFDIAGFMSLPVSSSNSEVDIHEPVIITPLFETECQAPERGETGLDTVNLLRSIFAARKADGLTKFPSDRLRPKFMDQFVTMASELDADGWFTGLTNSLCHLDLAPRNILIDPTAEDHAIITGILDWDGAVLAPTFMACAPPLWLWAWSEDEDEDERTANEDPPTVEQYILKREFENAAGLQYMRYAYEPGFRLARRLVRFAIDGIRSSEDIDEAETMLKEWREIYKV